MTLAAPAFADVLDAAARIAPHAQRTPVMTSASLDALAGCALHFKCENLQRVGAFKFRGACNAVFALDADAAAAGILTQSSGNHGAAIALAARLRGTRATVVVPDGASRAKLDAMRGYGAEILRCEATQAARDAATAAALAERGGTLVHPFDDPRIIAGQGTAALELIHAVPDLDCLLAPVGGGGLLSGCAIAARGCDPRIAVIGAEPAGAADAQRSLRAGARIVGDRPQTLCDGLRTNIGALTFPILQTHVHEILTADDAETVAAMRLLWQRLNLIVEPSAALALAVVLRHRERFAGRRVGIVLSGGNLDLDALPWAS